MGHNIHILPHARTRLTALCPGPPGRAGTRKVKPIWILLEQETVITGARDSEWQWHQLGDRQVCTSLQTDNHTSTSLLKFFLQAGCPSCRPTNSVKALKAYLPGLSREQNDFPYFLNMKEYPNIISSFAVSLYSTASLRE